MNEEMIERCRMQEVLKQALLDAFVLLQRQVPNYTRLSKCKSIDGLSPAELPNFMKVNDIPDDATFSTSWDSNDEACLCWDAQVPMTDKQILDYKRTKFKSTAWAFVYKVMLANGYKRQGFNSGLLKQFDDTTVYDMYMNDEWDRLVKYYSLPFARLVEVQNVCYNNK